MTTTVPVAVESLPVPSVAEDPYSDRWLDDPEGFQTLVREAGRVVWVDPVGAYAVGRHTDVVEVLRNWQDFGSAHGVGLSNFATGKAWRQRSLLLEADPPHHDAPHRVLAELLGPRSQRALRTEWFADADRMVRDLLDRGTTFDALTDLAMAFPLEAFPSAVGITPDGRHRLMRFSDFLFNAFGPRNGLVREGGGDARADSEWVDYHCRREALSADGLGAKIWEAADRGEISHEQAPHVVRSLFAAGVNTTVHALGALLFALASHPDQWTLVREDPLARRKALDEALRWCSPVQTFFRTTMRDVELAGVRVGQHEKVMVLLGAANRDPRQWGDPGRFDLRRESTGHVGFGVGIHACLGQGFARLEAEALLDAMARHFRTLELAGPVVRRRSNTLAAWSSIPVRVEP